MLNLHTNQKLSDHLTYKQQALKRQFSEKQAVKPLSPEPLLFKQLPIADLVAYLIDANKEMCLTRLSTNVTMIPPEYPQINSNIKRLSKQWQNIHSYSMSSQSSYSVSEASHIKSLIEKLEVDWLIKVFNLTFEYQNTILVRGSTEPEYFPATQTSPARIEFAHGFFSSALHEISHWCIAGKQRRRLPDYGYWYAPDGRNETQQQEFEKVEIKPQALECLFTMLCGKHFAVSQDNLEADFDTSKSTFAYDVYHQAKAYISHPDSLPKDTRILLTIFSNLLHAY